VVLNVVSVVAGYVPVPANDVWFAKFKPSPASFILDIDGPWPMVCIQRVWQRIVLLFKW
jgi:hypothetical protein